MRISQWKHHSGIIHWWPFTSVGRQLELGDASHEDRCRTTLAPEVPNHHRSQRQRILTAKRCFQWHEVLKLKSSAFEEPMTLSLLVNCSLYGYSCWKCLLTAFQNAPASFPVLMGAPRELQEPFHARTANARAKQSSEHWLRQRFVADQRWSEPQMAASQCPVPLVNIINGKCGAVGTRFSPILKSQRHCHLRILNFEECRYMGCDKSAYSEMGSPKLIRIDAQTNMLFVGIVRGHHVLRDIFPVNWNILSVKGITPKPHQPKLFPLNWLEKCQHDFRTRTVLFI